MSNPTDKYGWGFPTENQDPWYATFANVWQAADASVNSVEQLSRALGKTTCVISVVPTTNTFWPASTTLPNAQDSTVCSLGPYGRLSGTLTVPASGCQVRLDLAIDLGPNGASAVASPADIRQYFRLVTATSGNLTGDTTWIFTHKYNLMLSPLRFTIVASLAAGTHTVELQQRALSQTNQSSQTVVIAGLEPVVLWATPQSR
jgi:hypothetical protein